MSFDPPEKSRLKASEITCDGPDDHVWITIRCPGRPTISLDIDNNHGRRLLHTRIDGMGHSGILLDTKELGPAHTEPEILTRYCAYCGEELNLISSKTHRCKED